MKLALSVAVGFMSCIGGWAQTTIPQDPPMPGPTASQAEWKQYQKESQRVADLKEQWLVNTLYQQITSKDAVKSEADMKAYTNSFNVKSAIRDEKYAIENVMIPIKGGEFLMGSPTNEPERNADEGPQHRVKVSPFWMEQCEVTWDEYEPFMLAVERPYDYRNKQRTMIDAVALPSHPYVEMSFGMGKQGFPAVAMTQHAASKFCEWLSAKTGHFYRLPTEAEWEYACRAGTTNAYSFGDDPAQLSRYAWSAKNSDGKYHRVGKKLPNPWGLYDMHGNVAEWCLDQYDEHFYQRAGLLSVDLWNEATHSFPHVFRGGSWGSGLGTEAFGEPARLRSAARVRSERSWSTDPQLPPSVWYLDQANFIGFRVVRPLKIPSAKEMFEYWNSGVERK